MEIAPTRTLMRERLEALAERDRLVQEAEEWLIVMKEHTDCCGTPIVRRLVAALKSGGSP